MQRGPKSCQREAARRGDVETEVEAGAMQPPAGDASGRQELDVAKNRFFPWGFRGSMARPTPRFWPNDADFGLCESQFLLF